MTQMHIYRRQHPKPPSSNNVLHGMCMSLMIARYIYNIMYKTTGWRRRNIYNNCVICMKQSRGNFAAEKLILDVNYDKKNDSERDCHVNGYGDIALSSICR